MQDMISSSKQKPQSKSFEREKNKKEFFFLFICKNQILGSGLGWGEMGEGSDDWS